MSRRQVRIQGYYIDRPGETIDTRATTDYLKRVAVIAVLASHYAAVPGDCMRVLRLRHRHRAAVAIQHGHRTHGQLFIPLYLFHRSFYGVLALIGLIGAGGSPGRS